MSNERTPRQIIGDDAFVQLVFEGYEIVKVTPTLTTIKDEAEQLGRFGHHPDPAIDFEIEVGDLEAEIYHHRVGFENGTPPLAELVARIERAMSFRVGAVETAVLAKQRLREMEKEVAALAHPIVDDRRFLIAALDALEAVDSEIALTGHLKELVDCALAARAAHPPTAIVDEGMARAALRFYADPANWIDTPSWDGDPTCITPKAIPVTKEDGSQVCDCGDIARAALSAALPAGDGTGALNTVAQRIEQSEPDEGRKDAGSTPAGVRPEASLDLIRSAVRVFWVHDVNKPSWFSNEQNERLVARIASAIAREALGQCTISPPAGDGTGMECHGLDTSERVCFYEQDFYVLSNFSAFSIMWEWTPRIGLVRFDTSEAVYHFMKFKANVPTAQQVQLMERIRRAPSAHEAFKLAESNKHLRRPDWDHVKVDVMRDILRAKAAQHEYVSRKLLATGDRELVENSWRDDFWGWGPNRDGKNMLGKLWMEVRAELLSASSGGTGK